MSCGDPVLRRNKSRTPVSSVTVEIDVPALINGLLEVEWRSDSLRDIKVYLLVTSIRKRDVLQQVGFPERRSRR